MRHGPRASQRRPDVTTRDARHAGRPAIDLRRRDSATSSISGCAGKPPASSNSARVTNMPWSPVAMPVRRERRFISAATSRSTRGRPSMRTSKRPHRAAGADCAPAATIAALRGQPRVRVQEQQHVAGRDRGAGVHLRRPSARGGQHRVGVRPGGEGGAVGAAAVDDDHLVAGRAQRGERLERGDDAVRLVQRRHDDRQAQAHRARRRNARRGARRGGVFIDAGASTPSGRGPASGQRSAAARALAGGAAVAVVGDGDRTHPRGRRRGGRSGACCGLPITSSGMPSIWLKSQSCR